MNMNYLSAQSVSVRMSWSNQQMSRTMDGQTADGSKDSQETTSEKTQKSSGFTDMLSIMSKDVGSLDNIKAYVQDSVAKVLEKIAAHASKTLSSQAESYSVSVTSVSITINMSEGETIDDVKSELNDMLSEDGYWGVEKTSQRMFDLAKSIAGDNPNTLEKARDAVTKGFKQVEALWGGKLPQISYDTYDATMSKFDDYLEQISSSLSETYA